MHTRDKDRALTGTWVMGERRLAVKKGYRLLEIYGVYEYQVSRRGRPFVDYINSFLKLKSEAGGQPDWDHSTGDEDRYVESFWQSEGIRLQKEAIRYNAAKRIWQKLCLNSLWGKLTERNDRNMTKIIT